VAVTSRLRHVIESQQFSRALLEDLFARAEEIKREPHHFIGRLAGQVMAALFYEPSTRTRLSFEAAMLRLGSRIDSMMWMRENRPPTPVSSGPIYRPRSAADATP